MLSKTQNDLYIVAGDKYDKYPYEVPKDIMDEYLDKIYMDVKNLQDDLLHLYEICPEAFYLLKRNCWELDNQDSDEGKFYIFRSILRDIEDLKEILTHEDEITPKEDLLTLEDIGYKPFYGGKEGFYEKMLSETFEQEICEEVFLNVDGKPLHRKRTIDFEKTDYGKSSTNITYEELPIDDELRKVIESTIEERNRKDS